MELLEISEEELKVILNGTGSSQYGVMYPSIFVNHGCVIFLPPTWIQICPQSDDQGLVSPFVAHDLETEMWKTLGPHLTTKLQGLGYHPSWLLIHQHF